jgi:hypothetical protein
MLLASLLHVAGFNTVSDFFFTDSGRLPAVDIYDVLIVPAAAVIP